MKKTEPIIISVVRHNQRISQDTLFDDICRIWENPDVIFRDFSGAPDNNPQHIYNAFHLITCLHQKDFGVRSHVIEIAFGDTCFDEITVWNYLEEILSHFGQRFQTLLTMSHSPGCFCGTFLLNAVSYIDGTKFLDDNRQYILLAAYIRELTGSDVALTSKVLFDSNSTNYEPS